MDKILVISRKHRDDDNPVYNSFLKGISQTKEIIFIDYFNEYALKGKKTFEKYIKEILKSEKIKEIFFMFVSGDVTLDLNFVCEISQNRTVYMVFWDLEQHFEIIDRYYAQCADLVFIHTNKEFEEIFQLINIKAKRILLYDKNKYVLNLKRDIDVSFIGDLNKGNRKEYIKYLKQNGINIEVYGSGSENGKVSFKRMVEILNRSKISLNFSDIFENKAYSFYKNINNRIKQTKGRVVEVCMSGAFLLTEPSTSLNTLLDINNIDIFNSKEELLEKIIYYLKNEKEREEKSKLAQNEVIKKYDSLVLSKYLNEKPSKKYFYIDKEFKKIYGTFRWFYFLEFLSRFRFKEAFLELKEVLNNGLYLRESFLYTKQLNLINRVKNYFIIKKRVKKLNKIVAYPAGIKTYLFIKLFNLENKIEFIIDDNEKNKKIFNYDIADIESAKDKIVLITNYAYADKLEKNLKKHNINYFNPFKSLQHLDKLLDFDVYNIFSKIKKV